MAPGQRVLNSNHRNALEYIQRSSSAETLGSDAWLFCFGSLVILDVARCYL